MNDYIEINGARENNLKNINLKIPRNKMIVFTGVSGSGKSSLAFDTLYAEGQRRYIESLSAYARMFLGQMEKPDVDSIDGMSPAIAINQKTTSKNPRSTVGTVTEISDYLRLLYARVGVPYCPNCGKKITATTVDEMVDEIMKLEEGTKIRLLAPVVRGRKGEYQKLLDSLSKNGYSRVEIDGEQRDLSEEISLDKNFKHNINVVVDRLVIKKEIERRLTESLETVLNLSNGLALVDIVGERTVLFSRNLACSDCGISIPETSPRMFSFNNPFGACEECTGLGYLMTMDIDKLIPDKTLSLNEGCIKLPGWNLSTGSAFSAMILGTVAERYGFSLDTPYEDLSEEAKDVILYGTKGEKLRFVYDTGSYVARFEGLMHIADRRYQEAKSEMAKNQYEQFLSYKVCPTCQGARLKKESLSFKINGYNINELSQMSVSRLLDVVKDFTFTEQQGRIALPILKEIKARLGFLNNVGLEYLTLSRASATLSGGESQRIRLATQIGSGLVGVVYILDEPSIGLHQSDNSKLIDSLKKLRDLGNTLIVVEHDEETMESADYIVDIGPGAGTHGGEIVAMGTPDEIKANERSLTGLYLSKKLSIPVPKTRRKITDKGYLVRGACANNLKDLDVMIPAGVLTCITGVSGSGKSSLISEIISRESDIVKNRSFAGILNIDQSPIGRTPRSNPATYTGAFDLIRDLFAMTTDSKSRGYNKGRFSFNIKGGRCEACSGDGIIKIEMHFLPDIYVPCEVCKGKRYNRETLEVKYKGYSIADVLDMTVDKALDLFDDYPKLQRKIQMLYDVGLGYIKLGQQATTLSGGEAQRVKLSTELSKRFGGNILYILDEPTTGLHTDDVRKLMEILQRLVDSGNTVLVIEHNLDVIKSADYIIDLGPRGGENGGRIIATGTPEEVAENPDSLTGLYLKKVLR